MLPPPQEDQTLQGYQPPTNTQFSVFLANRVGKLKELIEIFDRQPLQLAGLSVIDSADHAVVRMITTNSLLARKLLGAKHAPFAECEILVVSLGNQMTLSRLCMCLLAAEVNINYAYPLMLRPRQGAGIAIHTDEQTMAAQILQHKGFQLLGEADLSDKPAGDDLYGITDN